MDTGNPHGLTPKERRVISRVAQKVQVTDVNRAFEVDESFGSRLADKVAQVGGSWRFIFGFSAFLIFWMVLNSYVLAGRPFDPAPYIGLNLVLSCVAALQAPIIMMSQNRQGAKDRLANKLDYETNVRAEAEILALHEKVDSLQELVRQLIAENRGAARQGERELDLAA